MSWSMPTAAQWNPAMAMSMPDVNMGYTPEQWTAMQQQNWQQWAQWQQQYAQWQSQYGEKYAEQMQAMQMAGGMPPLPTTNSVPPPAPPPPDKPPPPPPHENNQPLFGQPPPQPAPVPAPVNNRNTNSAGYNNVTTGNNQNWSYATETRPETTQPSVNAEALKKLAEEERLFDIQFQKWEEEIEKWRRENVNHPDKQAYKEYEQKFETCRLQLLERRQQMKLKRDRLLSNTSQAGNTTVAGNNTSTAKPPPVQTTQKKNYNENVHLPNFQEQPNQTFNPNQSLSMQNNKQYEQYNDNVSQTGFVRSHNKNIDPQDRYESYQNMEDYSVAPPNKSSFLPATGASKGIPGLDLVPEEKLPTANQEVIDISDDQASYQQPQRAPDYTTISKGINNILGDEKIMNILSMVRGQNAPPGPSNNQNPTQSGSYPNEISNQNMHMYQNNQWNRNDNNPNHQQFGNRQNNMSYNRHGQDFPMSQNAPVQNRMHDERQDMPEAHYNDRNRFGVSHMPPHTGPPNMRPNMPPPRPLLQNLSEQQNMNDYSGGGPPGGDGRGTHNIKPLMALPVKPQWVEDPLFTPSIIVEYEHKALRLKARDFIEPVHMFDYNHKSKDEEYKKKDFEKEVDELFTRQPRRPELENKHLDYDRGIRFARDVSSRDYERRLPREDLKDDYRPRIPPRDDYEDRRRPYEDRRDRPREDRDQYTRREERDQYIRREERDQYSRREERDQYSRRDDRRDRDRDREKDLQRDRSRDYRRDDSRNRSRSRERDSRKRGRSKESVLSDSSKKSKDNLETPKHVIMIDDLLESPGREIRPEKIVIIMRGPPGSGKSYLAKLIRDREAEHGGAVRIMSIDDYFMQEGFTEEKDPSTGKIVKKPSLKYEYDESLEETYIDSLKRAFKRSVTDGYFSFIIYDAVNDQLKSYADMWNFARQYAFQVYTCTMELDPHVCFKRNIHNRAFEDIQVICSRFFPTPSHHLQLDATTLLQNAAIPEVHMEDAIDEVVMEDAQDTELVSTAPASHFGHRNSPW